MRGDFGEPSDLYDAIDGSKSGVADPDCSCSGAHERPTCELECHTGEGWNGGPRLFLHWSP